MGRQTCRLPHGAGSVCSREHRQGGKGSLAVAEERWPAECKRRTVVS